MKKKKEVDELELPIVPKKKGREGMNLVRY